MSVRQKPSGVFYFTMTGAIGGHANSNFSFGNHRFAIEMVSFVNGNSINRYTF